MSTIDPIIPGGVGTFGDAPFSIVGSGVIEDDVESDTGSKCAYSLDGVTWTGFSVGPQFDLQITTEDNDIAIDTDSGFRRVYRQYRRSVWKVSFKIQQDDLSQFSDLHQAVHGARDRFYFTLDRTAVPIVAIYGKKIAGVLSRGTGEKIIPPALMYEMTIRSEPY
jgi:hypothetical protein